MEHRDASARTASKVPVDVELRAGIEHDEAVAGIEDEDAGDALQRKQARLDLLPALVHRVHRMMLEHGVDSPCHACSASALKSVISILLEITLPAIRFAA